MSTTYMIIWTTLMILAVGLSRIRDIRQTVGVAVITILILILSQTLAGSLAGSIGLDANLIFTNPELFLRSGPIGWLALLVMPCGWLGPIIGINLFHRRYEQEELSYS